MKKYRINYQTEEVHELNDESTAYEFLCTFFQIGATISNCELTIIRKIEAWTR